MGQRVLHILGDGSLAGLPRHVIDLALGTLNSPFPPSVIAPSGPIMEVLEEEKIPHIPAPMHLGTIQTVKALKALLRREARERGPFILHVHGQRAGWLVRLSAFGLNLKLVYTEYQWTHDTRSASSIRGVLDLMAMNFLDSVTTKTIATSQATAHFLLDRGITRSEKLAVIYNGAYLHRHPKQHASATVQIGTVGTIKDGRGYEDLIEAMVLLVKHHPKIHLDIVGRGSDIRDLERLVQRRKLTKHIDFSDFILDLSSILQHWDIYAHPHRYDSFGQALMDAMGAGLPVVATNVGATLEVVGDRVTGTLVEPRNPRMLFDALDHLASDAALRTRYGSAGYDRIQAMFTVEHMVSQTLELYETL